MDWEERGFAVDADKREETGSGIAFFDRIERPLQAVTIRGKACENRSRPSRDQRMRLTEPPPSHSLETTTGNRSCRSIRRAFTCSAA